MKKYYHEGNLMTLCAKCAAEERGVTTLLTEERPGRACDKCGAVRSGRPYLFPEEKSVRLSVIISEDQMAYLQEMGRGSQSNGVRWLVDRAMEKSREEGKSGLHD